VCPDTGTTSSRKGESSSSKGESLYHAYCATCHGPGATSSGPLPDLRFSTPEIHASWDAIVRGGAFAGKGMASFASVLDEAGAKVVHAYVAAQAKAGIEFCKTTYPKEFPELFGTACERPVAAR
jgi:mono/diheme cytochrome c family protein